MGDSYLYQWVATLFDYKFPNQIHETRTELGPGNSLHADIRAAGSGRYSVWGEHVFFSLPQNAKLNSTQKFELIVPLFPTIGDPHFRQVAALVLRAMAVLSALALGIVGIARTLLSRRNYHAIGKNIAPGLAVTTLLLSFTFFGGEVYFRATDKFPISKRILTGTFDPKVGMILAPGGKIKWTDGFDFWNEENANSLGLADNEPRIPKPTGTYRILVVGPSYVEALQVPVREKLQTLLSSMLKKAYPNKALDVVAMGLSGTSQSNQLAFFDHFKERLQPNLVLLVFAQNDFANNSVVLASIRQGWDPRFPPFLFLEKSSVGRCSRLPISPDYSRHLIPGTDLERLEQIKMMSPSYRDALGEWNPYQPEMDLAFAKSDLPAPVFSDALDLTKCAFAEWKRYALADGFKLAVVATEYVTTNGEIERLRSLLTELQIPLLDLAPTFAAVDPTRTVFKRDGHWNAVGHRLAAKGIFDYVKASGYLE